jgi:PLP dependent protein
MRFQYCAVTGDTPETNLLARRISPCPRFCEPSGSAVNDSHLKKLLNDRVNNVRERIRAACQRAGRAGADVTLVAVTKSVPIEVAALLPELGVRDLGENRPQEFWRRAAALPNVNWHFIGHLQRNKVERTLPLAILLHSVDSLRLLTALENEAAKQARTVNVLLEINASREANKQGFAPEAFPDLAPELAKLRHVRVRGLMTMAALADDPEQSRPTFAAVRELRDRLRGEVAPPHVLEHLSMGMTNDFEVAIEEGATLVRVGTALFEGLPL